MFNRDMVVQSDPAIGAATRPCAHCGKPVPQPRFGTKVIRYCQDEGSDCQRAYRLAGRHRESQPGLAEHVANVVVVAERLEGMVSLLNTALSSNLSPAGVERQVATVRAEAAAAVAAAHAERDEARRQARRAQETIATMSDSVGTAEEKVRELTAELSVLRLQVTVAEQARNDAVRERDETAVAVRTQQAALGEAERARAQAEADRTVAVRQIEDARERASSAAADLSRTQAELARVRADLERHQMGSAQYHGRLVSMVTALREELARLHRVAYDQGALRDTAERRVHALTLRLREVEDERDRIRAELEAVRFQASRIDEQMGHLAGALARLGSERGGPDRGPEHVAHARGGTDRDMPTMEVPVAVGSWAVRDQKGT